MIKNYLFITFLTVCQIACTQPNHPAAPSGGEPPPSQAQAIEAETSDWQKLTEHLKQARTAFGSLNPFTQALIMSAPALLGAGGYASGHTDEIAKGASAGVKTVKVRTVEFYNFMVDRFLSPTGPSLVQTLGDLNLMVIRLIRAGNLRALKAMRATYSGIDGVAKTSLDGITYLMIAARLKAPPDIMQELLTYSGRAKDDWARRNEINTAIASGDKDIVKTFLPSDPKELDAIADQLMMQIASEPKLSVDTKLEELAMVGAFNRPLYEGANVYWAAALSGDVPLMEALKARGVSPYGTATRSEITLLMLLARDESVPNRARVVSSLLDGASPEYINRVTRRSRVDAAAIIKAQANPDSEVKELMLNAPGARKSLTMMQRRFIETQVKAREKTDLKL